MKTSKIWQLAAMAVMIWGCGAPTDLTREEGLDITMADPVHGLAATLAVGNGVVSIQSKTITLPATTAPDDSGNPVAVPARTVRSTQVTDATGSIYADFMVDSATLEPLGTLGGRSFGTPSDVDTDSNASYWQQVVDSPAGPVLEAVARAADASIANGALSGVYGAVEGSLTDLSALGPLLSHLAGHTSYSGCTWRATMAGSFSGSTQTWKGTFTTTCSGGVHVSIINQTGSIYSQNSNSCCSVSTRHSTPFRSGQRYCKHVKGWINQSEFAVTAQKCL